MLGFSCASITLQGGAPGMSRRNTPTALRRPPRADADDPESGERATVSPPFDLEAFARESEGRLRAVGAAQARAHVPAPVAAEQRDEAPELSGSTLDDPQTEMRARFELGDHAGALDLAELLLTVEPGNLDAAECGEDCRTALENQLIARLGSLDQVPLVGVPRTQLLHLGLDHRAGFILSLVDGMSTLEMILDVCGMPKLDALRIVDELIRQKIVALK